MNLATLSTLFETLINYYITPHHRDMKRLHYRVVADLLLTTMRENVALTKEVFLPCSYALHHNTHSHIQK